MLAILGGFGAACAWALSTLCSSRSSRIIDPQSVVAWVSVVGLILIAPFVIAEGAPANLDGAAGGWLALGGVANIVGLIVAYLAYRTGAVALIAPLIATEGAIAALIAIAAGEGITAGAAVSLAVVALGVSLAALPPGAGSVAAAAHEPRVLALAGLAALCFGVSLYAIGHVSDQMPVAWLVLPARLVGTLTLALPLAAQGRLQLARRAVPLVLGAGACEVLGIASYGLGARHDVAVAAVMACQFAAIAAIAAYFLFGERLGRVQLAGVLVLLVGVSALSAVRG